MPEEQSRSEQLGKLGTDYRQAMIETMAQAWGSRPSDAHPLSHEEEMRLWLAPTSPAAVEAFKQGATHEEATQANQMWAHELKRQQADAVAQGATPEQLDAAGLSDDKILQTCRAHAWSRGKANAKNDPKLEVQFHERMAERARSPAVAPEEVP
jgi:hypothetical protein